MYNIHDKKSICSQTIFKSKMWCERGHSKYKFLNYKPIQKWHVSCVVLGKGLLP